jgi:hypothetical protein
MLKIFIAVLVLFLSIPGMAQENPANQEASARVENARNQAQEASSRSLPSDGFRGIPWGASPEQVFLKEGQPARRLNKDNELHVLYQTTLAGQAVDLMMVFVDGKLSAGSYDMKPSNLIDRQKIRKFFEIKDLIESKYGPPTTIANVGSNYAFEPDNIADFIKYGRAELNYLWEHNDCAILLATSVTEGEYEINIQLTYVNQRLHKPSVRRNEQKERDKL